MSNHHSHHGSHEAHDSHGGGQDAHAGHGAPEYPAGLQVSDHGYTISEIGAPARTQEPGVLSFQILGPHGELVTEFEEQHGKRLHLIVVRTDTSVFRHVHPVLSADGVWSIDWAWDRAGVYRVFADFQAVGGPALTLGRHVDVAGEYAPAALPGQSRVAEVDGYRVALDGDVSAAGGHLVMSVTRAGEPVVDLEPYLGAYGHLVALRVGDLAYLHVHPHGEPGDGVTAAGPEIAFHIQAPSEGVYRLYLDFQHDGVVRTAEFTVAAR